MEFDLSKENIQPLRGGRNVTQLGVALQAQNDSELQRELMQQKGAFEESIHLYEGDDPLDNWYNYIYWVEQSYPKHGYEGNLIPLLEDCLSKFENDERYKHDRRLCKLWIKYIDLQQNPLELFQLLYSKGICVSCADLYRAWAFYHEIAGDYKRADAVFQLGLRALAQPFEELNFAHQNMFIAIGKEAIQGVDERRREEERHALTSLVSYNHHQRTVVPNVRIGNNVLNPTPGILPNNSHSDRSNAPVTLYEDLEVAGPSIGACASVSVLEVARKQDIVHKENALKPGTWKKSIITKKVPQVRQPTFKVHEDEDPQYAGGIRLPPDFAKMNFDDFSDWKTDLFYPEPQDDSKIPMYPKHLVYGTPGIEYSPEEIRARKWFAKKQTEVHVKNDTCMSMMDETNIMIRNQHHMVNTEIEQAVQSILPTTSEASNEYAYLQQQNESIVVPRMLLFPQNLSAYENNSFSEKLPEPKATIAQELPHQISSHYSMNQAHASQNASYYQHGQMMNNSKLGQPSISTQIYSHQDSHSQHWTENNSRGLSQNQDILGATAQIQQWPNNTVNSDDNYTQNMCEAMKSVNDIWKGNLTLMQEQTIHPPVQKPEISKFQIHEDTVLTEEKRQEVRAMENTSSNSKQHFRIYDESENENKRLSTQNIGNPTGYKKTARESLRAPFSSQPVPEPEHELPRKTPSYAENNENFLRPADVKLAGFPIFEDNTGGLPNLNDSCTTQHFNFHLKANSASTPFNYKKAVAQQYINNSPIQEKTQGKKLFNDNEEGQQEETGITNLLSVILETSKEYRNSSSSGSSSHNANMLKTTTFNRESLKAIPECSRTYEESIINHSKFEEQPHQISSDSSKEAENQDVESYNIIKMYLTADTSGQSNKSPGGNYIDLTGDDSVVPRQSIYRISEIGAGDAAKQTQPKIQKNLMTNYESPMKNQFREMTCDSSNDSLSNSPVKGLKMDVDVQSSQNSNSSFRIDHHETESFDETILQKAPSDPFNNKYIAALLRKVGFPNPKYSKQYIELPSFPRLIGKKEVVLLGDDKYIVEKVIGKGAFGMVYKATNFNTGEMYALKHQKPANKWEYYITKEIRERCNPYMKFAYMDVSACYVSPNASVLASQFFKFGSLLDLANKVKKGTGKALKELVCIYYASEIITIVNTLHKCNIIHADIKPDNFLVTRMPPEFGYPSLQLIDFGNSIDMSLFPKGHAFTSVVNTENFICTEMKDGKPWTYQTDVFCIAATVHVLLFDKYMQLQKNGSVWAISQHFPRYLKQDLWKTFFFQMLNIESCDQLPDLDQIKSYFDSISSAQSEELQADMRVVANHVLGR